jgi:hypothetical protein
MTSVACAPQIPNGGYRVHDDASDEAKVMVLIANELAKLVTLTTERNEMLRESNAIARASADEYAKSQSALRDAVTSRES